MGAELSNLEVFLTMWLPMVLGSVFLYLMCWGISTAILHARTTPEQRVVIKEALRKVKASGAYGFNHKLRRKNGQLTLVITATVKCEPYWTEMCADGIGGEVRYMGYATATDEVTTIIL